MKDGELDSAGVKGSSVDEPAIHVRRDGSVHTDEFGLQGQQIVEEAIALVDARGGSSRALKLRRAADVIDVRVRVDDRIDRQREFPQARANPAEVSARIDHNRALGVEIRKNGAVAAERTHRERFDVHSLFV
jgi:hypothetical protein